MKRLLCLTLTLLLAIPLVACELKEPPAGLEPEPTVGLQDEARLFKLTEFIPPNPPEADMEKVADLYLAKRDIADNVTPFADQALKNTEAKNYIYSPLSAWLCLSFLQEGLSGEIKDKLQSALVTVPPELPDLRDKAIQDLSDRMRDGGLRLKNYLFVNNQYDVKDTFTKAAETYRADIYKVLLDGDIESSKLINAVIEQDSGGLIKDYYEEPIDPSTTAILMNILAMNARWETPFDPADTADGPFHLADGTTIDVPMMHLSEVEDFKYATSEVGDFLEMKYTSGDYLMLALPKDGESPEAALAYWRENRNSLEWVMPKVNVTLPKVKIQSNWDLKEALTDMGLGELFTGGPGMDGILKETDFMLSKVSQQAMIEIFEEGTTAAAVTEIPMGMGGLLVPDEPVDLVFDRPFAFAVYTSDGDLELFRGAVYNPLED